MTSKRMGAFIRRFPPYPSSLGWYGGTQLGPGLIDYRKANESCIALIVHDGEGMFSRGGREAQLVLEAGLSDVAVVHVPPKGRVGPMVGRPEDDAFLLAAELTRDGQHGAGLRIDELDGR